MPFCPSCKNYITVGGTKTCPICDAKLPDESAKKVPSTTYVPAYTATTPGANTETQQEQKIATWIQTCEHAQRLVSFSNWFFWLTSVSIIALMIMSGYAEEIGRYGVTTRFSLGRMFSAGASAIAVVQFIGAYLLKLVLNGFAVIVESAYRNMPK